MPAMGSEKTLSQRTLLEIKSVYENPANRGRLDYGDLLFRNNFPDWFVVRAAQTNHWDWLVILLSLRRGTFFFILEMSRYPRCIVPDYPMLREDEALIWGESYIQKLAALASTLPSGESLL